MFQNFRHDAPYCKHGYQLCECAIKMFDITEAATNSANIKLISSLPITITPNEH